MSRTDKVGDDTSTSELKANRIAAAVGGWEVDRDSEGRNE
jgi:hypothetical protein